MENGRHLILQVRDAWIEDREMPVKMQKLKGGRRVVR